MSFFARKKLNQIIFESKIIIENIDFANVNEVIKELKTIGKLASEMQELKKNIDNKKKDNKQIEEDKKQIIDCDGVALCFDLKTNQENYIYFSDIRRNIDFYFENFEVITNFEKIKTS